MKKTCYQILGVDPGASQPELQQAFRQALRELEESTTYEPNQRTLLQDAFNLLNNPARRATYDRRLAAANTTSIPNIVQPVHKEPWLLISLLLGVMLWAVVYTRTVSLPVQRTAVASAYVQRSVHAERSRPVAGRSTPSASELYRQLAPSVSTIRILDANGTLLGTGSGVSIAMGRIVTNCHVAQSGARLQVHTLSGDFDARLALADDQLDLCTLDVFGTTGPAVDIRDSSTLQPGEHVYALGAPRGLSLSLSEGLISALRTQDSGGTIIQTTAPLSPGSSGGGLFDDNGRLIGITTFQYSNAQAMNFAVAADLIPQMRERGVSANSVGSITLGQSAPIMGSWTCLDTVGGQSWELDFAANDMLNIHSGPHRGIARYVVDNGTVTIFLAASHLHGAIQDLTERHMVLAFDQQSLPCSRN